MKTSIKILIASIIYLFLMTEIAIGQTINLHADKYRLRSFSESLHQWSAWDTMECNIPITIAPEFDQIIIGNALNETFSIKISSTGRYYNAVDYEGWPVEIVIYPNIDRTYNILLRHTKARLFYNGEMIVMYDVQYLHSKVVK